MAKEIQVKQILELRIAGLYQNNIAKSRHIWRSAFFCWMMVNIFIRTDPAANIKPDKRKSTERIDGAVAIIMALDGKLRNQLGNGESGYDERAWLVL